MRSIALRVILFWMAVAGCREPNVQPIDSTRPQSLDIQPASATLWAGETQKFTATLRDVGGRAISGAVVSWRATNSAVLFVNDSGRVSALASAADASASVIAAYADLADTAVVTVKVKVTEVFNVWPDTNALIVGMTRKLVSRIIKPGVYRATIDRIPID